MNRARTLAWVLAMVMAYYAPLAPLRKSRPVDEQIASCLIEMPVYKLTPPA